MRQGILFASRVKPSSWARATRLISAPHQDLRRCALESYVFAQRRLLQADASPNLHKEPVKKEQNLEDGSGSESLKQHGQNTELDSQNNTSVTKPAKDFDWIFKHTGDRIESINGKSIKGIEEYVSHRSGTKLLSSWTLGPGNKQMIWVPGEAPRVRDMKVPTDLKPEAACEEPTSDWTLGSPKASFEPFFASLTAMNPFANFDNTDVIAWSGTLTLLLGVVRGKLKPLGVAGSAAFHITLVKNTILIKRLKFPGNDGMVLGRGLTPTFGGSFMNKITEIKTDENMPRDHVHAVRYDLAHLRCVVLTPVEAATGNATLPPFNPPNNTGASGSTNVKIGGRGAPPRAVTKVMTGTVGYEGSERRVNYKGQLRIKPPGLAKIWFERPSHIIQGHLEPSPTKGLTETARLSRVSVRETKPMLDQTEDACQLELRKLVALLDRLRDTARKAGGSCVLTYLPPREDKDGGAKLHAKFEVYKAAPDIERLVLDWHVERFWSKE